MMLYILSDAALERADTCLSLHYARISMSLSLLYSVFDLSFAARDRREMLEEIMRKGTSSLGTDVPSEREINRLAARSDEEFWLFEKMDEERRQKENYRSRLMDDHEVPEWAYSAPDSKAAKSKGFDASGITGKRKRKEVVYADTLSDLQWMKAVENGEDISKLKVKGKRKDAPPAESNELGSSINVASESGNENGEEESKVLVRKGSETVSNGGRVEPRSEVKGAILKFSVKGKRKDPVPSESDEVGGLGYDNASLGSEGMDKEHAYGHSPKRQKLEQIKKPESNSTNDMVWNGQILTWKTHKKKRSSYASQTTSSDSKGQSSGGKGNGWN